MNTRMEEAETGGEESLQVTRVVHSCVLLDYGNEKVLTDPWFSERPGYYHGEPLAMSVAELPDLSAVLVSHAHYDHYDMGAFASYRDKSVQFIVKKGIGGLARAAGFARVKELDPWESVEVGNLRVTATPAKHGVPENTYVIEGKGTTVFFGGDTLLIPELEEVAKRFPHIDVAFLPVNGLILRPLLYRKVVMDDVDAARLCGILKPTLAVPIHYAFTAGNLRDHVLLKYTGTAAGFKRAVTKYSPGTQVKILDTGQTCAVTTELR
jgi:L-ascorbate metabolism protein UlaG (beta-lactamase superfamily)